MDSSFSREIVKAGAYEGNLPLLEWIDFHQPSSWEKVDKYHLFEAAIYQQEKDVLVWLLVKNFFPPQSSEMMELLSRAIRFSNRKIIALFLAHILPDSSLLNKVYLQRTPLLEACSTGNLALVKDLISRGADVNYALRSDDQVFVILTPLMVAVRGGYLEVIKELIAKGAEVDTFDQFGIRAINLAIDYWQLEAFKLLLASGSEVDFFEHRGLSIEDWCQQQEEFAEALADFKLSKRRE